ncbi:dihydroorotate dehydrogenase [Mumia sp. zg.B53]|uniref:dihydroorotate dehydrogenase n=1 Tax=unclassified Mumia TaxID=2621872 RepID=UPI001C6EC896|nr:MULTISPECIES: dihydroorotate dehydrogenase [unclassified Mumia]MBW9206029.1 dihydroorotate dehydrogenase [Mumia sp. zg.B17]MBW9211689.1 dihydroorotate dehydrogenase [Mumia sp. zg.B21]MBW9216849.1 dihydroorotate dehydrogenase [Mumia sp. zg.B53]MDD9348428.1 dihydroorotate dehydrogenase [Mumia sp.]
MTTTAAIAPEEVDLSVDLCGVTLPNPVMTASGCAAAGRELDQFFDVAALGAVVTKSIMLNPRSGRPTPRMVETPSGMLNSIGLQGPGIDAFLARDLPWLVQRGARAIVSIAGDKPDDYVELARRVGQAPGVAAIEVNISCPNVENRGLVFACDPDSSYRVVEEVRPHIPADIPVFAKLTPDVTDIAAIAGAVSDAGADGVTVINTLLGLSMDPDTLRPRLGGVTGGLSGPAVRPVAVRAVWQIRKALPDLPIIGVGGIRTGFDALEFVLAGALAVQVGTVIFNDPSAPARIVRELRDELARRGIRSLDEVRGAAHG